MCGVSGILWGQHGTPPDVEKLARDLSEILRHRGPDDEGYFVDPAAGVALFHRRLAIRDLTETGAQPMTSECGQYVIAYNGEIYNAADLRHDLESRFGVHFAGTSDTEVLLYACRQWGVFEAVERLNGMFAFAVWDKKTRDLWLARDRLGEKPLYWAQRNGRVTFASQARALHRLNDFDLQIDAAAVATFMQHGYIPSPYCIFRDARHLVPGSVVRFNANRDAQVIRYWSPADCYARAADTETSVPAGHEAADALEEMLRDAVERRLVSDVPVGVFLSGGLDSSSIVALMAESAPRVKTFSIGFENEKINEAPMAKRVARHFNTEHHELYVTAADALKIVPSLPEIWDEPFADSSQIPTYIVSKFAREHITVALSGDGGDELFGGYERYQDYPKPWIRARRVPYAFRRLVGQFSTNRLLESAFAHGSARVRKIHWRSKQLGMANAAQFYVYRFSIWKEGEPIVRDALPYPFPYAPLNARDDAQSLAELFQLIDLQTYLPGDLLTKVDRATMAVSLEGRAPFLDHRLHELYWRLPFSTRGEMGNGKRFLRQLLAKRMPPALFERPKQGFMIPLADWLRGPLRDWAATLLLENTHSDDGILNQRLIEKRWREHEAGTRNHAYPIWNVLMYRAWRTSLRTWTAGSNFLG